MYYKDFSTRFDQYAKFPSLLAGFSASHSINGSSEPFCIKRKGFFLFLFFISDTNLKLRAVH
ncbi:MAG: hypothetical protein PUF09_00080, partial [Bacteroidales bacterium]|nr:hypothetical protein [Bacteroidales bacterium]